MSENKLSTFPESFWEILEAAKAGNDYFMKLPARNIATNIRHRFHYFRREAIAQGIPGAEKLSNLICSIKEEEGILGLYFINLGEVFNNTVTEKEIGPMPTFPTRQENISYVETEEQRDEGEEYFKKLLEKARGKEPQ